MEDGIENKSTTTMDRNKIQCPQVSSSRDLISESRCSIDGAENFLMKPQLERELDVNSSRIEQRSVCDTDPLKEDVVSNRLREITGPFDIADPFEAYRIHLPTSTLEQSMEHPMSNSTDSSYSDVMNKHGGLDFKELPIRLQDKFRKCISKANQTHLLPQETSPGSSGTCLLVGERDNLVSKNITPRSSLTEKLLSNQHLGKEVRTNVCSQRLACIFPEVSNGNDVKHNISCDQTSRHRARSVDDNVLVDGDGSMFPHAAAAAASPDSTRPDLAERTASSSSFPDLQNRRCQDGCTGKDPHASCSPSLHQCRPWPAPPDDADTLFQENLGGKAGGVKWTLSTSSDKTEGSTSSLPSLEEPRVAVNRQMSSRPSGSVVMEDVEGHSAEFHQSERTVTQSSDSSRHRDLVRLERPKSTAVMSRFGVDPGCVAVDANSSGICPAGRDMMFQDRVDLTVAVSNSRNVQAVGTFYYHSAKTFFGTVGNVKAQTKKELANNEKYYVETDACEKAACILEDEGILFICDSHSTGKAYLGKYLLRRYEKRGFEPVILSSIAKLSENIDPNKKQAILVTNIFGSYSFMENMVDDFKNSFHKVYECADDTKKFVFTSSPGLFRRGCSFLKMSIGFSDTQVLDLSTTSRHLSTGTKRSMLCKHLNNYNVSDSLIEKIVACESTAIFPTCCRLFAHFPRLHRSQSEAVKFFQEPRHHHVNYIRCLSEGGDKVGFAALVLTMFLEGLPNRLLREDCGLRDRATTCLSLLGNERTIESVIEGAESLLGIYLVKTDDVFYFSDAYIYDAVACVLGESHKEALLENCTVDFLHNRVNVEGENSGTEKERIVIGPEYFLILSQRFVREIQIGHVSLVCTHTALSNENFFRYFVNFCSENGHVDSVLMSTDHDLSILYWASWSSNEYIFKWVLREHRVKKNKVPSELIRKVAKACCISGNIAALKVVSEVVKAFDKIVVDIGKMELPLPTFLNSGEKIQQQSMLVNAGSLLHTASFYGHSTIVTFLAEYTQVDLINEDGSLAINQAAKQGHADTVRLLIEKGSKILAVKCNRNTAMADACETGRTKVVEVLLENNGTKLLHVEGPEPRLMFPIHQAVLSREHELVELLMIHGANPDAKDRNRNTAFHAACMKRKNLAVLKVLKPTPVQLKKEDKAGNTCLHLACKFAGLPMVHYLIDKGSEVNARNKIQQTPLHVASENNDKGVVKLLLSKKANVFVFDIKNRSPLHLTESKTICDILKENIEHSTLTQATT